MSTRTSTSAASDSGSDAGTENSASSQSAGSGDGSTWLSAVSGGTKRPTVIIVMLLVVGLVAGGGVSLLVRDRRPLAAPAAEEQPAPAAGGVADVDADQDTQDTRVTPPQRPGEPDDVASVRRWRPSRNEVYPNAKRLASRVVERLTNFEAGAAAGAVADQTGRRFNVAPSKLGPAVKELVRPGTASTGTVVYPQLGGMRPDSASVMVVVDQALNDGDRSWVERRTVDVRLRLRGSTWVLERVGSGGGVAEMRPESMSPASRRVLEHPRIQLSDSARWDIYSGTVDDGLLTMMARAAERHEIAIVTIATGHPMNVFATDTMSNHTRGRAVDIFSVDGEKVVESRKEGSPAFRLARWLYNQGVPELGSPWAFDGVGGRSFTDIVHADHIHFAM